MIPPKETDLGPHCARLGGGDSRLRSGEYYDRYTFEGRAGQRMVFDLRGTGFDPYLIVEAPAGPGDDFVRTGGPQTGYQHLVVDRGSIGPFDVLFR